MTANRLIAMLSEVEGRVSIHDGVATFEDGTSVNLRELLPAPAVSPPKFIDQFDISGQNDVDKLFARLRALNSLSQPYLIHVTPGPLDLGSYRAAAYNPVHESKLKLALDDGTIIVQDFLQVIKVVVEKI